MTPLAVEAKRVHDEAKLSDRQKPVDVLARGECRRVARLIAELEFADLSSDAQLARAASTHRGRAGEHGHRFKRSATGSTKQATPATPGGRKTGSDNDIALTA